MYAHMLQHATTNARSGRCKCLVSYARQFDALSLSAPVSSLAQAMMMPDRPPAQDVWKQMSIYRDSLLERRGAYHVVEHPSPGDVCVDRRCR
jgi:hypothetical protein